MYVSERYWEIQHSSGLDKVLTTACPSLAYINYYSKLDNHMAMGYKFILEQSNKPTHIRIELRIKGSWSTCPTLRVGNGAQRFLMVHQLSPPIWTIHHPYIRHTNTEHDPKN